VVEYLKGTGPAGEINFVVTQRRSRAGRQVDDYGPWSDDLEVQRYVVFVSGTVPATAQMFGSDDNFVIAAAGDRFVPKALDDVRVALRLASRADFPQMLRGGNIDPDVMRHLPDAGYLLAGFVRDTADTPTLEALLGVPDASSSFRQVILTHRMNELILADQGDAERTRLARIMLKILGEPGEQAKSLQWVIAQTHLRNALFDASGSTRITPAQVFAHRSEPQAVDRLLRAHPFSNEVRARLSDWVRGH
jgi:hypothetical protein